MRDTRDNDDDEAASLRIILCSDAYPIAPVDMGEEKVAAVFRAIGEAEFSLVNFEIPLTDRGAPAQKLLNIRTSPSAARGLSSLGFKVATLANNHAPDYGWDGLVDTRRALEAEGIRTVGTGDTIADALRPVVTTVKSRKIGVIAFSCLTPAGAGASASRPGIACMHVATSYEIDPWYQAEEPGDPSCISIRTRVQDDNLARACEAVREARTICDFLIVSVHWGFGSTEALADYQRPLAEALIEAGADVIHGHHPHAIQAIGFHRNKPILFSANVLIGQQIFLPASDRAHALWRAMSADGFLTRLHLDAEGVGDIEVIPTTLNRDRLPEVAPPAIADRIFERLARLSPPQGGAVRRLDGRIMVYPGDGAATT